MKTKQTLLVAGAVSAIMLSAPLAQATVFHSLIVTEPTGTVRIQQSLPCGEDLDTTRRIVGGRIEVTPATVRDRIIFDLTRLDLFLAPLAVHRECRGLQATAEFFEIGVRLAAGVRFTAVPVATGAAGRYQFTIPKEQFLIYESALDNVRRPDTAFKRPSEDVTGLIDLGNGTVEIHVALTSQFHFRAGCIGDRCVIDETGTGSQLADVAGRITPPTLDRDGDGVPDVVDNCPLTANRSQESIATPVISAPPDVTLHSCTDHTIGRATATELCQARGVVIFNNAPARFAVGRNVVTWFGNDAVDPIVSAPQTVTIVDTTAPTASCTPVSTAAPRYQVASSDDCAGDVSLRLGSYNLTNGETIQIEETGRPGVRLVSSTDGIRHFLVGRGEAVIRAADAAGNVANAICQR